MSFIIFDLEFNQDVSSLQNYNKEGPPYPFEIIQIGAIKLDLELNTIDTFNRYVKPAFYAQVNPFVTELTGITTEQLLTEESFPEVYQAYTTFINGNDSVFCTWGMSDMAVLYRNVRDHQLDLKLLPNMVINLQPYVSKHFNLPQKQSLRLQHAVERLQVPIIAPFHSAIHDAFYTAEVFKKVYNESMEPKLYDPSHKPIRPKKPRTVIDTEKLLQQFEKMYARKMTEEEQEMIQLAYKMGRTNQFVKYL